MFAVSRNLSRLFARLTAAALAGVLLIGSSTVARSENWPQWRGPTGAGYSSETDLPVSWSVKKEGGKEVTENIVWKAPLEKSTGHSSPIVWNDRVFITTSSKQTSDQERAKQIPEHQVVCFRASDGKRLWTAPIQPGKQDAGYAIYATPTPVTDGQAVFAWFGSAVIAAVDSDGHLLWRHERPAPMRLNPGVCSSPILYQDTVILLGDQAGPDGFLQGLSKKTGEVIWEQKRANEGPTNTTPLIVNVAGKPQMIITGGQRLEGLDPASGKLLWFLKTPGFGESPVFTRDLVYSSRGGNEPAALVDPSGAGDIEKSHVKWRLAKLPGEYASPIVSGDYILYVANDGILGCLKLSSGEQVFTERLEGLSKLSSPIVTADGKVCFATTGKSYVVKAGPKLEVLGKGDLGGGEGSGMASPAISGGRIYVRDFNSLWCIGKQ